MTKKAEPSPVDIASLSIEDIKEEVLSEALAHIRPIYETLGASDRVAKGPEFLEQIKTGLNTRFRRETRPSDK